MTWAIAGTAIGTALVGAYSQHQQAEAQQKQKKAEMIANAAQIQYSPWTGAKAQIIGNTAPDPSSAAGVGALQGGVAGAMMGSQFRKAGAEDATAAAAGAAPATAAPSNDVNNVSQFQAQPLTNTQFQSNPQYADPNAPMTLNRPMIARR